ncbi:drug resistance transporter, EmrB/QacA subfamily protein [Streptomyces bingchenggensis BCW-1]|uniref:Drug resistance transporter, EmrB/QacA subfamily protein n=1 Tax=Streptomyces bingchenggensis (strain BCW-1) TaxID=749414 RepID=D7CC17_STRBB|nr:drug resistance transporter, EmrB/QacA subfamily protein [Streptomyces bingchenggensis BCW-1]
MVCARGLRGTADHGTCGAGAGSRVPHPPSTSVLLNLFETEQERNKAVGVIAVSQMLGLPLGPIVGGALLNHFWWGSVFLINVPLVLVGTVAVTKLVPESRGSQDTGIDFVGVLISSVGLTALTFGTIEAGEKGWGSTETVMSLLGGALALILFVVWEARIAAAGRDPLVDLTLFRGRGFIWGSILSTIVSFAMFGLMFALPQYFQAVRGRTRSAPVCGCCPSSADCWSGPA